MTGTGPSLGARLLRARIEHAVGVDEQVAAAGDDLAPLAPYVEFQLARLRLLHDVPFRYLVPDARLLPDEKTASGR